jgi:ABC-type bacteriocin/lantibiotic exporter with double-glycine peptidase domain
MLSNRLKNVIVVLSAAGLLGASADANVWLDVPFVKQEKNGCGAASIAMIMQYWQHQQGKPASASEDAAQIQRQLYSAPAHGIYASDLERYLSQHGFRTFAFRGEWSDLQSNLAKGRPLLVALQPGSRDPLHFVVIAGVEAEPGFVLMNDPAQRKLLKQDRSDFEKQWKAAGNWTLLALPRQ